MPVIYFFIVSDLFFILKKIKTFHRILLTILHQSKEQNHKIQEKNPFQILRLLIKLNLKLSFIKLYLNKKNN